MSPFLDAAFRPAHKSRLADRQNFMTYIRAPMGWSPATSGYAGLTADDRRDDVGQPPATTGRLPVSAFESATFDERTRPGTWKG